MKAFLALFLLIGVVYCNASSIFVEREREQQRGMTGGSRLGLGKFGEREEHVMRGEEERMKKVETSSREIEERELEEKKKLGGGSLFVGEMVDYFLKNPNTKMDKECFSKLMPGQSIDFVIDIAPSPSMDEVDKMLTEKIPIAKLVEHGRPTSASRSYFKSIRNFIDMVTVDMKPERTHSVIYNQGRKFYLKGRDVEDVKPLEQLRGTGEFTDVKRNLKTLWPVPTKESTSFFGPMIKNNLGRMTKLALWNRDNGLPVVLSSTRRSKPIYTVVISDGSSGAKITDLVEDLSRTTVIDIGNRRFVKNIPKEDIDKLASVYTSVPAKLFMLTDTVRYLACRQGELSFSPVTYF